VRRQGSGRFFEKNAQAGRLRKKLLLTPAFEWPQFGLSKALGNKSFFASFFAKKEVLTFL
jgi:hypothetical protein